MSNVQVYGDAIANDYQEGVLNVETIRSKYHASREDMYDELRQRGVSLRADPRHISANRSDRRIANVGTKIIMIPDDLPVGAEYQSGTVISKTKVGSYFEYKIKFGGTSAILN